MTLQYHTGYLKILRTVFDGQQYTSIIKWEQLIINTRFGHAILPYVFLNIPVMQCEQEVNVVYIFTHETAWWQIWKVSCYE